jgi:hypothetical protein
MRWVRCAASAISVDGVVLAMAGML